MYSIGIDIGGTNLAGGIVSQDTALTHKHSVPFPGRDVPYASIDACVGLIHELLEASNLSIDQIDAIGLAVPGEVDYSCAGVRNAYNLGYHDFPLKDLVQAHFPNTVIHVENDANAAALAEYYFGAFRGHSSGMLITLGTGVGGGMIYDNKLFNGGRKRGFEAGHFTLQYGGEPCTCGNQGCFEAYCSATALIREGTRSLITHPDSMIAHKNLTEGHKLDAKLVIDCAKAGDATAVALFDDYVAHLGAGIASLIALFNPEVIALGGGVSNAGAFLFDAVEAYVSKRVFFADYKPGIVPAQMGNDAGIIGAGMLYRQDAALA